MGRVPGHCSVRCWPVHSAALPGDTLAQNSEWGVLKKYPLRGHFSLTSDVHRNCLGCAAARLLSASQGSLDRGNGREIGQTESCASDLPCAGLSGLYMPNDVTLDDALRDKNVELRIIESTLLNELETLA